MVKSRRSLLAGLSALLASIALPAPSVSFEWPAANAQPDEAAVARVRDSAGVTKGQARFAQQGPSVWIEIQVSDLPPGFHGFHIHAVGTCDPATAFMSAGGHLDPASVNHPDHAGDLPSLYVTADGTGALGLRTDRFTVSALFDADGSALVIHADRDNFGHIPDRYGVTPDATTLETGDAGPRLACGMLEQAAPS